MIKTILMSGMSMIALSACTGTVPTEKAIEGYQKAKDTAELMKIKASAIQEDINYIEDKAVKVMSGAQKIKEGIEQITE